MKKLISISTLLLLMFSCKSVQRTFEKDISSSLNSGTTSDITNALNTFLLPFSSLYNASVPERGYTSLFQKLSLELLKVKCIKEVKFTEGISKSLPPQKSFKMNCLTNGTIVSYLGVILLSETPKIIQLTKEEPLK